MTKVWYDTEFHERGHGYPIDLISIGMVREDGQELYLVNSEMDWYAAWAHLWLREHVLAQLPLSDAEHLDYGDPIVVSRREIAHRISMFLRVPKLQLWAWYGSYDHVVLAQLFGTMIELPDHIPMYTHDLKQEVDRLHVGQLPAQPAGEHNALADARHLRDRALWLREHKPEACC